MNNTKTKVEVFSKPTFHDRLVDTYNERDIGEIEGFVIKEERPHAIVTIKNKLYCIPIGCLKTIE